MSPTSITLSIALFLFSFTTRSLAQSQFQNIKEIVATEGYRITPLLGDYDGDGDMDLLGTGFYGGSNATILLRNDDGEFVLTDVTLPWFYNGGMYQWADLDNDNDLDIVAGGCPSDCYNSKILSIYRNDGADHFTLITTPTNLPPGQAFTLADYNNDGLTDIEIAPLMDNGNSPPDHAFYTNTGNFVFQKTFELTVSIPSTGDITWGDLNNDGWQDFVLLDHAYKNLHDGTFEVFPSPDAWQVHSRHIILDTDHDGDLDVITPNGLVMQNDGTGQFSFSPPIVPYESISSLQIIDVDGDGNEDLLASGGSATEGLTQLFRSNGDGTYTAEDLNEQYTGWAYNLIAADMDHDNDPDIVLSGVFLQKVVILENGLTIALSKPTAPVNLQSSTAGGVTTLSWDAGTDAEHSPLEYNLYLAYGDDFILTPNADTVTGAGFVPRVVKGSSVVQRQLPVSALPEGYFQWSVQSVDAELNASPFAAPREFTLYKNSPANAPTDLRYTALADHTVSLTWADNSGDETGFTLERSSLGGNTGFEAVHPVAANMTSDTDDSVLPRHVYYYRIRLDGSAAIAYSNVIRVQTPSAIGIAPDNVTATALNSASAKVDWDYTGAGITGFVIERSADDNKHFVAAGTVTADQRSFTGQQLESGRTYFYRVFAVNGDDVSDYSDHVRVTMPLKEFVKSTLPSLAYESRYVMGGIAWGDYDNDGFDDLFLAYKAQLFHNKGNGTFEPVTSTGIATSTNANDFVATWGDYDNDGSLDLFYYDNQIRGSVYRGHGDGTFTKIQTIIGGDVSTVTNATWTDFDLDGDLDLSMTGGHYTYRYDGNDTFVRVDFPGTASFNTTSVASWGDYDDDGDPDVFLGNYGKDEFFRNNGDGTFTAIADQRVTKDYNFDCCPITTPTALWTDFNNDRKLDLTVFHAGGPIYGYANHASKLDSAFYLFAYERESWKNMFWTDYDNDGDLDLFAMGQYNIRTEIWENKEGQSLRQLKGGPLYDFVETDAAFSWNDFDNDGYSDLFQFDTDRQFYKNLSNGNAWIKVRLRGRTSNSTGLGAKVFVKANNHWQRSDVTTHHSYRVQQGFMSLFGLGSATRVDSVKVLWPSGSRQYLTGVDVNQVLMIDEGDAQEKATAAPSNLLAAAVYPASVALTWTDRSSDETGFVIEMAAGNGPFAGAGTVDANVTSFTVTGLTVGIQYKFRVRAAGANGRWTNIANAQIRLFTEVFAGDLTTFQSQPAGMAWGDPDNDGDPDLFVGSYSFEPDAVYYNDKGTFTRTYLRNTDDYSRQAQWIDYNNDGYQDLHVSVGGGIGASPEYLNDFLYKNDGTGKLVEQKGNTLATDGYPDYSAAWGDLNKDGYLDMIVPRSTNSSVFLNLGGNLVPQQGSLGLAIQGGTAFLSDLDNDRDLDVITAGSFGATAVFENVNGQFAPLQNAGFPYSLNTFVLEDFNNDGTLDLLAVDQTLRLYLSDPSGKKFTEKPGIFPSLNSVSRLTAGDFDNNGFVDVLVNGQTSYASSNNNRIFLNNGNLQFTSLADPILDKILSGTAIADVNKDGHLDVVALAADNSFDTRRYLLRGNANDNHWLRIRLKGAAVNKFGVGARIRLFTGNTSQVRDIRSSSPGTFSDEQIAHFGLGTTTAVDYVKVEWPSGEDQWIANPTLDREMVIEQQATPGPPAPASPSNLTATYRAPGYVDLLWTDNAANEKSFRIERAVGTDAFTFFRRVPPNTVSYTDSTFVNYSEYRLAVKYRVVAVLYPSVESAPSNEASLSVITGIEEDQRLDIYPQPASSRVFIRSGHPMQRITIAGARGEMIAEMDVQGLREVEIPVREFAPGIYFMRITDDRGTNGAKLLVASGN